MKLSLTFKDPDVLSEALNDERYKMVKHLRESLGLSEAGAEAEADARLKSIELFISDYMQWGEYLTVTFDDEEQTAEVNLK
jgi:hypothetical protein